MADVVMVSSAQSIPNSGERGGSGRKEVVVIASARSSEEMGS